MVVLYLLGFSFNELMNAQRAVMEALKRVKNPDKIRIHLYPIASDDATQFVAGETESCESIPVCRIVNYSKGGKEFCHKMEKALIDMGVRFIP